MGKTMKIDYIIPENIVALKSFTILKDSEEPQAIQVTHPDFEDPLKVIYDGQQRDNITVFETTYQNSYPKFRNNESDFLYDIQNYTKGGQRFPELQVLTGDEQLLEFRYTFDFYKKIKDGAFME